MTPELLRAGPLVYLRGLALLDPLIIEEIFERDGLAPENPPWHPFLWGTLREFDKPTRPDAKAGFYPLWRLSSVQPPAALYRDSRGYSVIIDGAALDFRVRSSAIHMMELCGRMLFWEPCHVSWGESPIALTPTWRITWTKSTGEPTDFWWYPSMGHATSWLPGESFTVPPDLPGIADFLAALFCAVVSERAAKAKAKAKNRSQEAP